MTATKPPLAVDLDGTLLLCDSLIEMFVVCFLQNPFTAICALFELSKGIPAFKAAIFKLNSLSIDKFPIRQDFLQYLRHEKSSGRSLHLVTAANQGIADAVFQSLKIFDDATGSSETRNLKGREKLAYLQERFPDGFSYAGDCAADLPIWEKSASIILAGADQKTIGLAKALGVPIEQEFHPASGGLRVWAKALRLHQWSKNILIFVPFILAHKYTNLDAVLNVTFAFFCMGFIASGTYLLNDLFDLNADRAHRSKHKRAIASGAIGAGTAIVVAAFLISAGLLGAAVISLTFLSVAVLYIVLTLFYSLKLKKIPMFDVFVLGMLFSMRLLMGTVIIHAAISPWLFMFSLFFFLSLSLVKRYTEVVALESNDSNSADELVGRDYRKRDEPLILAFGVSTSVVSVFILMLYVLYEAFPANTYKHPDWLWFIMPIILVWIMRVWFLSHRGEMHDDPVVFAIKDRVSWGLGALLFVVFVAAVL